MIQGDLQLLQHTLPASDVPSHRGTTDKIPACHKGSGAVKGKSPLITRPKSLLTTASGSRQETGNKAGAVIRPEADVQEGVVIKEDALLDNSAPKTLRVRYHSVRKKGVVLIIVMNHMQLRRLQQQRGLQLTWRPV